MLQDHSSAYQTFCPLTMRLPGAITKKIIGLLFAFLPASGLFAQQPLPFNPEQVCTYDGTPIKGPVYEFAPSEATNQMVGRIMGSVGLKPRFEVKAANVPNAAAVVYNNQRYILYSQNFVELVHQATKTNWGAVSIIAHEIGHHLNGHTLASGGSRPSNELEADEFSGFVLQRMGATMLEAQAAMNALAMEEATATHPPRNARLEAIAVGWYRAKENTDAQATIARTNPAQKPAPEVARPAMPSIPREEVVGKVVFNASPEKEYYLTKKLQLVRVSEAGKEVVGKLAQTTNGTHPFVIQSRNNTFVYLGEDGYIYSKTGEKMGYVTKI